MNALVDKNREEVKKRVRDLSGIMGRDMINSDMDPYVLKLLMQEKKEVEKGGKGAIAEEDEENSD